jgi:hypothetical protein
MTTYSVYTQDDHTTAKRGLTACQAMDLLLTYDGYAYEIRHEDCQGTAIWNLYHSDGSTNSTRGARRMVKTVAFSMAGNEDAAIHDIATQICTAGWRCLPECMTDADFNAMLAELETCPCSE